MQSVYVYDPTANDELSKVRGVGRYLQILRENFPDFIFTNNLHPVYTLRTTPYALINPFFNLLKLPPFTRRIAKKQIAVIHDLIPFKYPQHFPLGFRGNLNVFINRFALRNYDHFVTDSETSKKDIIKILKIPENKITVIYPTLSKIFLNGIASSSNETITPRNDKSTINNLRSKIQNIGSKILEGLKSSVWGQISTTPTPYTLNPKPYFCLYVGDATWNKNLVNLAKAIKIADVTCVFVGKIFDNAKISLGLTAPEFAHPWQKEFRDFVKEIKGDKRFILSGYIADEDLINLYKQTKLNILISRDEGFGFSYLEAATIGCNSLLADIAIFHEIAADTATYVDPESPNKIARKIQDLVSDKNLDKNALLSKALERSKTFNSGKFVQSWTNLLSL